MWIQRIQVEEGFLDGLDLVLDPGLNVIIGARGVGKTSVLELLRYALRLRHVDDRRAAAATQHAEAILQGGRVLVTYVDQDERTTIARAASDTAQLESVLPAQRLPLMLGQNELEGIGLNPRSRLRLIDAHAGIDLAQFDAGIGRLNAEVEALTLQMRTLSLQLENLRQQEFIRPTIARELAAARASEAELLSTAGADVARLRDQIGEASTRTAVLRRSIAAIEVAATAILDMGREAGQLQASIRSIAADLPEGISTDDTYTVSLEAVGALQGEVFDRLNALLNQITVDAESRRAQISQIDEAVRPIRRQFEDFEAGAGLAAQVTARLEQQLADIDAGSARATVLDSRRNDIRALRDGHMLQVDELREKLWALRSEAVATINARFAPRIQVELAHYGDTTAYVGSLSAALRGSGVQHNQLAEWLAERVSPQELVRAVEAGDTGRLEIVGEVTSPRIEKVVSHLANSEALGSVLTARVDDFAQFRLLVGRDYRDSEELSTGQRCSVVLPLLLADPQRLLLLDQPEDHLDNAYLVDNTVRTLLSRAGVAQTMVATHNANIPVLGDAGLVISLESDGRRGFVRHSGPLSDVDVVATITELMEGGREAFERRAAFYSGHVPSK